MADPLSQSAVNAGPPQLAKQQLTDVTSSEAQQTASQVEDDWKQLRLAATEQAADITADLETRHAQIVQVNF
jgi:hypothetical protein